MVLLDGFLQLFGKNMFDIENSRWAILIIILMYLWKNISFSIVLFWSGINWIPQIYHEQCQLDGATGRQEFQYITWILLKPTTLVVLLMSIVNSFKVFKEIYMLYGAYPSPYVYMLQHYMNNQFLSLNMQKLSAAAWCMFLILGIFLGISLSGPEEESGLFVKIFVGEFYEKEIFEFFRKADLHGSCHFGSHSVVVCGWKVGTSSRRVSYIAL